MEHQTMSYKRSFAGLLSMKWLVTIRKTLKLLLQQDIDIDKRVFMDCEPFEKC